jgi:hypothetical protein
VQRTVWRGGAIRHDFVDEVDHIHHVVSGLDYPCGVAGKWAEALIEFKQVFRPPARCRDAIHKHSLACCFRRQVSLELRWERIGLIETVAVNNAVAEQ